MDCFSYSITMTDEIRLLILTHNYPRYNGDYAGIFISLLAKNLIKHGIKPIVLAPHDPGSEEYEVVDGVTIYRFRYAAEDKNEDIAYRGNMQNLVLGSAGGIFKFKRFLDCFRTAAMKIIEKEKIDVIAGHWLVPSGIVMKTIAKKYSLPMVLSSHGTDVRMMRKYSKALYRYLKSLCRKLYRWTVVSSFLKETILSTDDKLKNILEVLPLPHDESVFYKDSEIKKEDDLIVAITRFTNQKRVDYLIKAIALVVEKRPSAHLEIYGSGQLEPEVKDLISKFGLESNITINQPVPQERLREIYNRASVVVLNSFQEGFGLALSEAMLCGTAVVGVKSGGITDIIKNNETGILVDLDNSQHLSDALLKILSDEPLRTKLAESGHKYASETYASGPLTEKYAGIIKQAAGK